LKASIKTVESSISPDIPGEETPEITSNANNNPIINLVR
jgi:hypothetical protein